MATSTNSASEKNNVQRRMPGEEGVWVFIMGDMLVFALFFGVFLYYRAFDVEAFNASQKLLNQHFGAINTLILLTSSWFIVMSLHALRARQAVSAQRYLLLALGCGAAFAAIKFIEYGQKLSEGIYPTTNDFFMYFFIFTAIHFMHLVVGMGVLVFMYLRIRTTIDNDAVKIHECGAAYWHLVDLLWVVLFPLFYLLR